MDALRTTHYGAVEGLKAVLEEAKYKAQGSRDAKNCGKTFAKKKHPYTSYKAHSPSRARSVCVSWYCGNEMTNVALRGSVLSLNFCTSPIVYVLLCIVVYVVMFHVMFQMLLGETADRFLGGGSALILALVKECALNHPSPCNPVGYVGCRCRLWKLQWYALVLVHWYCILVAKKRKTRKPQTPPLASPPRAWDCLGLLFLLQDIRATCIVVTPSCVVTVMSNLDLDF